MSRIAETHAGGVLKVRMPAGQWGSLPVALLEDDRLALDARAVAAWLAVRPHGWQISVAHMQHALGLKKDRWWRVSSELEQAGYLRRSKAPTGPRGAWVWTIEFCPIPETAQANSSPAPGQEPIESATCDSGQRGFTGHGPTKHGPAVHGHALHKNRRTEEQQEKDQQNRRERAQPQAAVRHAARGAQQPLSEFLGVVFYEGNDLDAAALAKIKAFGGDEIAAAVPQAMALDPHGRAWPSAVLRILLAQQAALKPATSKPSAPQAPAWARGAVRRPQSGPDGTVIDV